MLQQSDLQFIFETTSESVFILDRHGNVIDLNLPARKSLGLAEAQVVGKNLADLWPGDVARVRLADLGRVLLNGEGVCTRDAYAGISFETRMLPIRDDAGVIARVLVLSREVTSKNPLASELQTSKLRWQSLVQNSPDTVMLVGLDGIIGYINRVDPGVELTNVVGASIYEITAEATRRDVRAVYARARNTRQIVSHESVYVVPGKAPRYFDTRVSPEVVDDEVVGFVVVARETTDRIRLEHQLRQSEKMRAIGTLAGGVAHELNNTLAVVLGTGTLLAAEREGYADWQRDAKTIVLAARRGRALVEDLIAFSGGSIAQIEVHPADAVIDGLVRGLQSMLPNGVEVQVEYQVADRMVLCNRAHLTRALLNICTNASESMDGAGVIQIVVCLEPRSGHLEIRVSDSGRGMSESAREQAFEPFFTDKEVGSGPGLGLSVAYGLIRDQGGTLTLSSSVGVGTSVILRLPRGEAMPEQPQVDESSVDAGVDAVRVLLVEHEDALREVSRRMLEVLGCRVSAVNCGSDAVHAVRTAVEPFQLAVVDLGMPKMDGLACFKQIHALDPNLTVFLCSGVGSSREDSYYRKFGLQGLLQKPFDLATLAEVIGRATPN